MCVLCCLYCRSYIFSVTSEKPCILIACEKALAEGSYHFLLHTSASSTAVPRFSTTACSLLRSSTLPTCGAMSTETRQHHIAFLLLCAESVQASKSGTLWLPDKYGNVFTSETDFKGTYRDLQQVLLMWDLAGPWDTSLMQMTIWSSVMHPRSDDKSLLCLQWLLALVASTYIHKECHV